MIADIICFLFKDTDQFKILNTVSSQNNYEPHHEKTNILIYYLVGHKPGCIATEDG